MPRSHQVVAWATVASSASGRDFALDIGLCAEASSRFHIFGAFQTHIHHRDRHCDFTPESSRVRSKPGRIIR